MNTLPETTWHAFREHGTVARTVDKHLDDAHRVLRELSGVGIDMERLGAGLQEQGVQLFVSSFDAVVAIVEAKRRALLAAEAG